MFAMTRLRVPDSDAPVLAEQGAALLAALAARMMAFHPDDRPLLHEATAAAAAAGRAFEVEHRVVRPGGEVRWLVGRGRGLPGRTAGPAGSSGSSRT